MEDVPSGADILRKVSITINNRHDLKCTIYHERNIKFYFNRKRWPLSPYRLKHGEECN